MSESSKNISIDHGGEAFFTDSIAIMHGESKFILDFKQSTPRLDQVGGEQQQSISVEHSSIMMDPTTAKVLLSILKDNVEKYEDNYGEIELPEREEEKDIGTEHDYIG